MGKVIAAVCVARRALLFYKIVGQDTVSIAMIIIRRMIVIVINQIVNLLLLLQLLQKVVLDELMQKEPDSFLI